MLVPVLPPAGRPSDAPRPVPLSILRLIMRFISKRSRARITWPASTPPRSYSTLPCAVVIDTTPWG